MQASIKNQFNSGHSVTHFKAAYEGCSKNAPQVRNTPSYKNVAQVISTNACSNTRLWHVMKTIIVSSCFFHNN